MYNQIQKDLVEAMKSKDKFRLDVIRMLKSAIMNESVSGEKHELSDDEIMMVVKREVKKRESSMEEYKKYNKLEMVESLKKEVEILSKYLPPELSDEELNKIIDETFEELKPTSIKDMGKVMHEITSKYGSRIDASKVSKIVKTKLA